jgi:hypothetical protein
MIITDLNYMEVATDAVQGAGGPSAGGSINVSGGGEIFEFSGSIKSDAGKEYGRKGGSSYAKNVTKAGAGVVNGGFTLHMSGGAKA